MYRVSGLQGLQGLQGLKGSKDLKGLQSSRFTRRRALSRTAKRWNKDFRMISARVLYALPSRNEDNDSNFLDTTASGLRYFYSYSTFLMPRSLYFRARRPHRPSAEYVPLKPEPLKGAISNLQFPFAG